MGELIRFGVSIDSDLLERFDRLTTARNYPNRSEALRDLIRDALVQANVTDNAEAEVLGSLTLVYDHHASDLTSKMMELQHQYHELVISVMHAHINHDDCMEMIMLRGNAKLVQLLANTLLGLKGVKHGQLFITLPANAIALGSQHTHSHH